MFTCELPPADRQLLTKEEVAEMLGVRTKTIEEWCRQVPGFPRPLRVTARTVRFRLADVNRFIAERVERD
jgi:predicted DNA-binding transcriptional regulator AlpA